MNHLKINNNAKVILFFPLIFLSLFMSCRKEANFTEVEPNEHVFSQKKHLVSNSTVINNFKYNISFLEKNNNNIKLSSNQNTNKNIINLTLDKENVYKIQNTNSPSSKSIFIEGKLNNNDVALFKLMDSSGNITDDFFFCETLKENEDLYVVNYYNSNLEKINTIKIIPSQKNILSEKTYNNSRIKLASTLAKKDVGQDVMDCMTDAYTQRGWLSVWVTVQTAFIPATAVAIAGACVGLNIPK